MAATVVMAKDLARVVRVVRVAEHLTTFQMVTPALPVNIVPSHHRHSRAHPTMDRFQMAPSLLVPSSIWT